MTTSLTPVDSPPNDEPASVRIYLNLDPPQQSRLSIFFRYLLAIPHIFIMVFVSIGAAVCLFFGGIAALFTGRLPAGIQKFLTGYLRYGANVGAYNSLLIAKWPAVTLEPNAKSELTVDIDYVRLNRAAVFFRLILILPAWFLGYIMGIGIGIFTIIMWFCGIIMGRTPRSLHQAVATVFRYQLRMQAYYFLLTPTQAYHDLFGDVESDTPDETAPEPADDDTRKPWVITKRARTLIVVSMVLGVIGFVGIVVIVSLSSRGLVGDLTVAADASGTVTTIHTDAEALSSAYPAGSSSSTCTTASCVAQVAYTLQLAVQSGSATMESIGSVSSSVVAPLTNFEASLASLEVVTAEIASSTSLSAQTTLFENSFLTSYNKMVTTYNTLISAAA